LEKRAWKKNISPVEKTTLEARIRQATAQIRNEQIVINNIATSCLAN
jgi:hypothetical protein